mgnify:CR=1 FL=1
MITEVVMFRQCAEHFSLVPVIGYFYQIPDIEKQTIFKGGTSLSKAFNIDMLPLYFMIPKCSYFSLNS